MDFNLNHLLNFPYVTILSCQKQEGLVLLKLEFLNEGISCPHCQTYTENLHQTRPILVRDMSILGQPVYLKVPRRQFITIKSRTGTKYLFEKSCSKKKIGQRRKD